MISWFLGWTSDPGTRPMALNKHRTFHANFHHQIKFNKPQLHQDSSALLSCLSFTPSPPTFPGLYSPPSFAHPFHSDYSTGLYIISWIHFFQFHWIHNCIDVITPKSNQQCSHLPPCLLVLCPWYPDTFSKIIFAALTWPEGEPRAPHLPGKDKLHVICQNNSQ